MKHDGEMSPKQRALRQRIASVSGKLGAARRQSKPDYDPREATAKARSARWAKLLAAVDPDAKMTEEEREEKAGKLWRSQMLEGQLKRAQKELRKAG